MTLWDSVDADSATSGQSTAPWAASGVSIDTRTLRPGDLFVALQAARDGHDFVGAAFKAGAAAAMVTHRPQGVAADAPLLIVPDVQAALEALGAAGRARSRARVVAVTGSVGKTSTKEMLRAMLGAQGRTHASVASYNNHWGVPLTLARMPQDTQFAVIEIGMNHPGEIAPLARMARPHVALITTVAAAHLEAFDDIAGIAREKASILLGLEPGGVGVLNRDCDTADVLADEARRIGTRTVGFGASESEYVLHDVTVHPDVTVAQASARDQPVLYKVGAPGRHLAMNALGALAAVEAMGADLALAVTALAGWSAYSGRGTRETICLDPAERGQTLALIDDSYNANPTSMAAALDVLAATEASRRIAVLGDMKELGPQAAEMHARLAQLAAMDAVGHVHCVGPLMRALYDALPPRKRGIWSATSDEMARKIPSQLDAGDAILVKGSLSTGLGRVVEAIRACDHAAPATPEADREASNPCCFG